jgi:glyoxylate/hydroxypyruvate/2-ketogluconate reductase
LVARAVFEPVLDKLRQHFDVDATPPGVVWSEEQLIQRLQGKVGVLTTGGDRIGPAVLAACPQLRIAANLAVGYNNFDLDAMSSAGVLATNAPDVLTETTADFGMALLLATARRLTESEHFLRAGRWKEWSLDFFVGAEVHGSTLGILGMGRIGQAIARRAAFGFGMPVIYHNRSRLDAVTEAACRARYVSKEQLLAQADHLMLVLPYTPANHHVIGEAELAQMKPTATLVNIARGGIVDENALVAALKAGRLAAAGIDVFEGEPQVNSALLTVPNIVLTPHIASATVPTRMAMATLAADNLIAYLTKGRAITPLNHQVIGR